MSHKASRQLNADTILGERNKEIRLYIISMAVYNLGMGMQIAHSTSQCSFFVMPKLYFYKSGIVSIFICAAL